MREIIYNSGFKSAKELIEELARMLDEGRLCGLFSGFDFQWSAN
jgi:hypothetical protein